MRSGGRAPPKAPPLDATAGSDALLKRIADLERQLDSERKLRKEVEGPEVKKPDNLPPRFSEQSLRDSLTNAFAELGVKAQVTSIDCTEYPCIAYGDGFGSREDSDKLAKTPAMAAYAGDAHRTWGWNYMKDGTNTGAFGIVLGPQDDQPNSDLQKRVEYRVRMMQEAMH